MKTYYFLSLVSLFMLCGCTPKKDLTSARWELCHTTGFPSQEEGMENGVSACYAGALGGKLIMAGGCNFPDVPASDGGKKKFYKGIYAADITADSVLNWRRVGELPFASAYGVATVYNDRLICAGGTDGVRSLTDVFSVRLKEDGRLAIIDSLPSLPESLDNFCGTVTGRFLLLAGGNRKGVPSNTLWCLDLEDTDAGWTELPSFPGEARTQAVCAAEAQDGGYRFYIWGGFAAASAGSEASLSTDGYCYSSDTKQWTAVAAPCDENGEALSVGGGTAVTVDNRWVLCTGGVNKDIFLSALRAPMEGYMLHEPEWYKFNDRFMVYDMKEDAWNTVIRSSHLARAGAVLVSGGNDSFYNINGELKPGIRTPEITRIWLK